MRFSAAWDKGRVMKECVADSDLWYSPHQRARMLRSTLRFTKVIPVLAVLCAGALDARDTVGGRTPAKHTPSPLIGAWGGRGLSVVVTDAGATLEFDCAHGTIDQPIWPTRLGRFTASGSYTAEKPGPIGPLPPPAQSARYSGQIRGN